MWCIPRIDREFRRRLFDVISVYSAPYDAKLPVVCMDEKLIELHADVRVAYRKKGVLHRDYEYERRGTCNLFIATEPKGGRHWVKVTARRTHRDFAYFMRDIARRYPDAIAIVLVMDNLNTHGESSLIRTFGEKHGRRLWARFRVHYTPCHGSWLNLAELALSITSRCAMGKRRFATIANVADVVVPFWRRQTRQHRTFHWKWTKASAYRWLNLLGSEH